MSYGVAVSMTLMATPKKATAGAAKKAAVKKAARLTAPPKGALEAAAAGSEPGGSKPITFLDREIMVQMPDENQILVWRKIVRQFEVEGNTQDRERQFVLMERGRKIVDSVIVLDDDKEWIDDMLIEKKTTMAEVVEIILRAMKAHHPEADLPDTVAEIE